MKYFYVCFIIGLMIFNCSFGSFAKDNSEVSSTQGLTLEDGIEKTIKKSKNEQNEFRAERKLKKQYHKNVSRLKMLNSKKESNERELEFLKSRLEIKKQKLEELTSDGSKKGENL